MDSLKQAFDVLRVLRHPAMLRLWLAQIIYLSLQFTASYALIVLISDATHSATMVGLVIIALTLPLVLLAAPAGMLVDRMDRRKVLWISNVIRAVATAVFVLALVANSHQLYSVYLLAFFFSLVGLFFSPAEGAIIPSLVDEEELLPALSLYNLTLNISQAFGLLLLGPLALNLLPSLTFNIGGHQFPFTPIEILFVIMTVLYLFAALLTATLPYERKQELLEQEKQAEGQEPMEDVKKLFANWQVMRTELVDTWKLVSRDSTLFDALWQACFGGLVMLTIAELATIFVQRLLQLPTKDTSLIFAPAGIGLVAGSLFVPIVVKRFGSTRTIVMGMVVTGLGFVLLPLSQTLFQSLYPAHWSTAPLFLLVIAILTAIVGLNLDFIVVPAQTQFQERTPDSMRGRVLTLYQAMFNGGAIPVMLFMGALTDLIGIRSVIYMLASFCFLAAIITGLRATRRKKREQDEPPKDDEVMPLVSSRQ